MPQTTLRSGDAEIVYIPYTPGANVNVGDVVLLGNTTGLGLGIAPLSLEANKLGKLAISGGVYDVVNLNNAANYAKVWWDNTNKSVTTVSTNNALFGYIVSGGGGGINSTARALLFSKQ